MVRDSRNSPGVRESGPTWNKMSRVTPVPEPPNPLSIMCKKCLAPRGYYCVDLRATSGDPVKSKTFHKDRVDRAKEKSRG